MTDPRDNENEELLKRFRADLQRPVSERYYSEDDLVFIFDNAGDAGNDYLRMEALLLGARLFPDSRELLERRAIFYRQFADRSFSDFLEDNGDFSAPLWEILKMSDFKGTRRQAVALVESFIDNHRLDTDEEVIQFIAMARDLDITDWVYDNIDLLKKKVDFQPTLLYEIAMEASIDNRDDITVTMLEQLTEAEPFSAIYWTMLASRYLDSGRSDDAASAIDLALAIDPDYIEAIKVKIDITGVESPDSRDLIYKAFELEPSHLQIALLAITAAFESGDRTRLDKYIDMASRAIPDSAEIVTRAVECGYGDVSALLERLYNSGYNTREQWRELAEAAFDIPDYETVSVIMQTYERLSGKPLNHDLLLLKILFNMQKYDVAANVVAIATDDGTIRTSENMFVAYVYLAMSLLRMGDIANARVCATTMLGTLEGNGFGRNLTTYGVQQFFKDVIARLDSDEPTDWKNYNPIGL